MGWIDYKKVYDIIPHSFIKTFRVASTITGLMEKTIEKSKIYLVTGDATSGNLGIIRGISERQPPTFPFSIATCPC